MVDRVKNVRVSLLSVIAIIGSVEYFKIWTRNNYDVMHCYTRVNKANGSNVFQITSNGTRSCDPEAQYKQIHKKLNKLKLQSENAETTDFVYCLNENLEADKVIDTVVGYYSNKNDQLQLQEYCHGAVNQLI